MDKPADNLADYVASRYEPLEIKLLEATGASLSDDFDKVRGKCLEHWKKALKTALRTQEAEDKSCAYMSVSLLLTSLSDEPQLQIDFYDQDWVYGEPWARELMPALFLFNKWWDFVRGALDEAYYVRSRLARSAIQGLFYDTADKLAYLFACFAKYFMDDLAKLPEFAKLKKEPVFYVTAGMYFDWQERLYGELPEVDLLNLPDNTETTFREFRDVIYKEVALQDFDLHGARFKGCLFRNTVLRGLNLRDALFEDCRFYDVDFIDVRIAGCSFRRSYFASCRWQNSGTEGEGNAYFGEAEITDAKIKDMMVINSDFSHFRLKNNTMENVSFMGSNTRDSDWEVKDNG